MVVGNSMEAETICGLLRTEGIACDHRHTDVGAGAGDAVGDSGPREVLVARDDLESARRLVTTDASWGRAVVLATRQLLCEAEPLLGPGATRGARGLYLLDLALCPALAGSAAVVTAVNGPRTQIGHIRNDTRDASRRIGGRWIR
jgi:hypothetical protein